MPKIAHPGTLVAENTAFILAAENGASFLVDEVYAVINAGGRAADVLRDAVRRWTVSALDDMREHTTEGPYFVHRDWRANYSVHEGWAQIYRELDRVLVTSELRSFFNSTVTFGMCVRCYRGNDYPIFWNPGGSQRPRFKGPGVAFRFDCTSQKTRAKIAARLGSNITQPETWAWVGSICKKCVSRCLDCQQFPNPEYRVGEMEIFLGLSLCLKCASESLAGIKSPAAPARARLRNTRAVLRNLEGGRLGRSV